MTITWKDDSAVTARHLTVGDEVWAAGDWRVLAEIDRVDPMHVVLTFEDGTTTEARGVSSRWNHRAGRPSWRAATPRDLRAGDRIVLTTINGATSSGEVLARCVNGIKFRSDEGPVEEVWDSWIAAIDGFIKIESAKVDTDDVTVASGNTQTEGATMTNAADTEEAVEAEAEAADEAANGTGRGTKRAKAPKATGSRGKPAEAAAHDQHAAKKAAQDAATAELRKIKLTDAEIKHFTLEESSEAGRARLLKQCGEEAKARRDARAAGKRMPRTPALAFKASEHSTKAPAKKKGGDGGGGVGAVNLTDEDVAKVAEELALKGFVTVGAMVKELRGTPRGTNAKRMARIAGPVLARLAKAGKLPEKAAAKKAPAKKAPSKGTRAPKAPASKAAGKKAPAKKATAPVKRTPSGKRSTGPISKESQTRRPARKAS